MGNPIIKVRNVSKKYRITHQESYLTLRDSIVNCFKRPFDILKKKKAGSSKEDFWALKDVSFDVNPGEVVGVIGRNGAGKTTLLKILSRITYPAEGEIRLRGRIVSLLEVGTGFHPELTGRENIYFNGSMLGMKKREIDKNFDAIVDFSGVEKFIDTPVKRFSSGMQVRLAFSVAAYLEPEILLIDEVLAVGDAEFQKKCLGKMKDVALCGRTVLFVSHNMSAVNKLCSRTLMLENGRLIADGNTSSVVSKYLGQNLTTGAVISSEELAKKMEGVIRRNNPTIRLKEVALFNEQDLPCSIFNSDEPIKICVTYECLIDIIDLRLVVCIVDEENRFILISQNTDDSGEAGYYERKVGIYKSFCIIPPNTFGQKCFYISIHLINIKTEHLVLNKILMFDVIFQGYNMQHGEWRDAFLRPQLKWNTDFIG